MLIPAFLARLTAAFVIRLRGVPFLGGNGLNGRFGLTDGSSRHGEYMQLLCLLHDPIRHIFHRSSVSRVTITSQSEHPSLVGRGGGLVPRKRSV